MSEKNFWHYGHFKKCPLVTLSKNNLFPRPGIACVAVFSVPSQASGSRARARGQRWQKKLVAGGRPSPRSSFCSRPMRSRDFSLALAFSPPPLSLIFCHLCPRALARLPLAWKETEKTATQARPGNEVAPNIVWLIDWLAAQAKGRSSIKDMRNTSQSSLPGWQVISQCKCVNVCTIPVFPDPTYFSVLILPLYVKR